MAVHKFWDAGIYIGGYDVQTNHRAVTLQDNYEELETTALGHASRRFTGGLSSTSLTGELYLDYGASTIEHLLSQWRGQVKVFVVTPDGDAVGDRAFFGSAFISQANPLGGTVGEMHKTTFAASGGSGYPVVRGQLFKAAAAVTSSSNSSAVQLGAVTASQRIYAAIHVLSASGTSPTLDVIVQSDDNSGMTTATTRLSLTQATAITSEFASAAGAIADDYWRISWTIGGSATPTFSFVVALGIW